ncbi:hypothetical protein SNE35_16800 [Paucibacter sp. R3-3]|uniref:Uncharacterized protein n=2 Tax=Roseateles agri TaxID=3098619 RepID=A0ABU5DIR0_9BURK|nr:hypothetical protein [Paucibacter sp. R3-3]
MTPNGFFVSRHTRALRLGALNDQLLAALAEASAAAGAEASMAGAEAASEAAGAGAATGAGAGAASSFLPQAARATAATREANRIDFFILVLKDR